MGRPTSPETSSGSAEGALRLGDRTSDPLYLAYHDEEWGVPVHDDRHLFELLVLEGAQAGLSLVDDPAQARGLPAGVRRASTPRRSRGSRDRDVERLLADPGIVRNRLKVDVGGRQRPRACSRCSEEHGSLDDYLWYFVGGEPIVGPLEAPRRSSGRDATSRRA